VPDLAEAGHLRAVLPGEGHPDPASKGHGLACFHEEARRRDVPGDPAGESVRRADVHREDLVEAQGAAAIAHGRAPSETMRRCTGYAGGECSKNIHLRRPSLHVRLVTLLPLLPAVALADGRFEELRKSAQAFDGGLGEFLELYLGDCGTASNTANCRNRSKEFQTQAKGKRFYALIREDEAGVVGMSDSTPAGGGFTLGGSPHLPGGQPPPTHPRPH